MAKSPSITILERDMSTYTVTNSSTILAVVGYATKGPIGKATKVYSYQEFLQAFGTAPASSPYSALAVKRAFNQGNQMVYLRVADNTATVAGVLTAESTPGTYAKQSINHQDGFTVVSGKEYTLTVQIDEFAEVLIKINTTSETLSAQTIASTIAAAITPHGSASAPAGVVTITTATVGDSGKVAISAGTGNGTDSFDLLSLVVPATKVNPMVAGVDASIANSDKVLFVSKEKGSSCNKIAIQKTSSQNPITNNTVHKIEIFYDGNSVEVFNDVSLKVSDANYFADKINADPDNGGSKWVTVYVDDIAPTGNVTLLNNVPGTYYQFGTGVIKGTLNVADPFGGSDFDYLLGSDGIPTDATAAASLFVNALAIDGDLGNMDEYDFHILITPDAPVVQVQEAAIALTAYRKDFLYLVDPPFGYNSTNILEWHNGQGHGRNNALNTSFGALYWPWLKDYNSFANEYVWCPPSVFMAEKLMEIDVNYGPWAAPRIGG